MPSLAPYAIYFKAAAIVALVAVGAGAAWWATSTYYQLKITEADKQHALQVIIAKDQAAEAQEKADKITYGVNAEAAAERARRLEIALANAQRVQTYVSPETDRLFPLPCGFIRLHDAAARSVAAPAVPIPTGKADGDRCDVTASYAATVIQQNYRLALDWRAEVGSWWKWYDQQHANWEAYRKVAAQ